MNSTFKGYDYTAVSRKFLLGMALKSANNEFQIDNFSSKHRFKWRTDIVQALTIHHWTMKSPFLTLSPSLLLIPVSSYYLKHLLKLPFVVQEKEKSRNSDTLGPVELNVWLEKGDQGDRREQDDQGEVSIIIFGMSESSGFQKYSIRWVFQALFLCLCLCRCICHCLCLCICVLWWFLNSFHHKLSEYVWL